MHVIPLPAMHIAQQYAGFDCDYSLYPLPEAQALFFRHYMAEQNSQETAEVSGEA